MHTHGAPKNKKLKQVVLCKSLVDYTDFLHHLYLGCWGQLLFQPKTSLFSHSLVQLQCAQESTDRIN